MWFPDPDTLTQVEKAALLVDHATFISAEHAYTGTHSVGKEIDGQFPRHLCPSVNLAEAKLNLRDNTFKLALIRQYYASFGNSSLHRATYYSDIIEYEAEYTNWTLYPNGGKELLNRVITTDAVGVTTISWDDLVFEVSKTGSYFDTDLWVVSEGVWGRASVIAVIYDDTARNKPIIQMSVIPSPNSDRFLSNGDSHTITNIKVKI